MKTHTPGPWNIADKEELNDDPLEFGGQSFGIWSVKSEMRICGVEVQADGATKANCLLIAASPEMFSTLNEIAQLSHNGGSPDMTADELRKLLFACGNRAMIALAKAKGE